MAEMANMYELNSILKVDDQERAELERKKLTILSAIQQQEQRFYHELDQNAAIAQEVGHMHQQLERVRSEFDITALKVDQIDADIASMEYASAEELSALFLEEVKSLSIDAKSFNTRIHQAQERIAEVTKWEELQVEVSITTAENTLTTLNDNHHKCEQQKQAAAGASEQQVGELQQSLLTLAEESSASSAISEEVKSLAARESRLASCLREQTEEHASTLEESRENKKSNHVHFTTMMSAQKELRTSADATRIRLKSLQSEVAAVEEEFFATERINSCCSEENDRLHHLVEYNQARLIQCEYAIQQARGALRAAQSERDAAVTHISSTRAHSFQTNAESLEADLKDVSAKMDEIRREVAEVESQLLKEQTNQELSGIESEFEVASRDQANVEERCRSNVLRLREIEATHSDSSASLLEMKRQKQSAEQELNQFSQLCKAIKTRVTELQMTIEPTAASTSAAEVEALKCAEEIGSHQRDIDALNADIATAYAALATETMRLEDIKMQGEQERVRSRAQLLQDHRKKKMSEIARTRKLHMNQQKEILAALKSTLKSDDLKFQRCVQAAGVKLGEVKANLEEQLTDLRDRIEDRQRKSARLEKSSLSSVPTSKKVNDIPPQLRPSQRTASSRAVENEGQHVHQRKSKVQRSQRSADVTSAGNSGACESKEAAVEDADVIDTWNDIWNADQRSDQLPPIPAAAKAQTKHRQSAPNVDRQKISRSVPSEVSPAPDAHQTAQAVEQHTRVQKRSAGSVRDATVPSAKRSTSTGNKISTADDKHKNRSKTVSSASARMRGAFQNITNSQHSEGW